MNRRSTDNGGVASKRTRRILVVVPLATALALGVYAFQPSDSPEEVGTASLSTPLWSARRAPEPIREDIGTRRLAYGLGLAVAGFDSCVLVDDERTRRVAIGAGQQLIPASATKILTGVVALTVLGPDHRFTTTATAASPPGADGEVGDLWLVGGGDPVLATADYAAFIAEDPGRKDDPTTSLEALADQIVEAGVKSIDTLHGDDTRHDSARSVEGWSFSYALEGAIGPLSALTVNDGFVEWEGGNVGTGDPAGYAASELADLLEDRGVAVGSTSGTDAAPADATEVAAVESVPLAEVVAAMVRSSDNQTAEVLTRELGYASTVEQGDPDGSTQAGLASIAVALDELGVDPGRSLSDGSGLHRDNAVSCEALLDALDPREETAAVNLGLAMAGESGTLAERFVGTPLEGRLRAKTGTLNGVTALTGFIETEQGRQLPFAFLANGDFDQDGGFVLQGEVASAIAAYPDVAPADTLVPVPLPPA